MGLIFLVSIGVIILVSIVVTVETAFFTVGQGEIALAIEQHKIGAKKLKALRDRPSQTVVTLVILNNTLVTVGSMVVAFIAAHKLGDNLLGIVSALLTIALIIFSEIIPKTIGELHALTIARCSARALELVTFALFPLVWILERITKLFHRTHRTVSEDELKALSSLGMTQGSIEDDEREIIHNAFQMNDMTPRDVMTPRTVIEFLYADKTLNEQKSVLTDTPYSRYPVVGKDIDDVVGAVHTKDLLIAIANGEGDQRVADVMLKPFFVKEDIKLDLLLSIFKKTRMHMAIVKDQFGGTAGVITLEDVVEQLVGEIVDESDEYADLREYAQHRRRGEK